MTRDEIVDELMALLGSGGFTTPFTSRMDGFDLKAAYDVVAMMRTRREAGGDRVAGRKIGFTNRTIWQRYNVFAPIWNYVWASTVLDLATGPDPFSLVGYSEPRIEPEIMFGLHRSPEPGMSPREIAGCIEWVAHGFEIVQSIFPGWTFSAPDATAAYGLHGALLVGPRHALEDAGDWVARLQDFRLSLSRNGTKVDEGRAANILDGPLQAIGHLVDVIAADGGPPLMPGEIVSTGTITDAFPVTAGESWSTELEGIGLEGARVRFG